VDDRVEIYIHFQLLDNAVNFYSIMGGSSYRRNFYLDKKNETITIAGKSILKSVKLQSLVANCCYK
jgi:hypothetical protein